MFKKIVVFMFPAIFVLNLFTAQSAYAKNYQRIKINPSDGYKYTLKRFEEKIVLFILNSLPKNKENYYEKLIDVRFAELTIVAQKKQIAHIEKSSQRYSATVGEAVNWNKNKSLNSDELKKIIEGHLKLIPELQNNYDATTAEWRFLENDINSLKEYLKILR